ncbi:MAG: hypothetical protein WBH52_30005 [Pseudomonas aeruginosa]
MTYGGEVENNKSAIVGGHMNNLDTYISEQEALRDFYAWSVKQWDKNGGPNETGKPFYDAEIKRLQDTEERLKELKAERETGGTFDSWLAKKEGAIL